MSFDDFYMSFTFHNPLKFTLATPIELSDHEVAVKFISLPDAFVNMTDSWVDFRSDEATKRKLSIRGGFYETLDQLVATIRDTIDNDDITLELDNKRNILKVTVGQPRMSLQFSPVLASTLRLPTGSIRHGLNMHSSSKILFSGKSQVFLIATNFSTPQLYNGKMVSMIGAVQTDSPDVSGMQNCYFPVKSGPLQHVDINIVTNAIQPVSFITGSVSIVLHFRKRRSQ